MTNLLIFEAITSSLVMLFELVFFRDRPETPPCAAAGEERVGFRESFGQLKGNINFILIFISGGLLVGNFNMMSTVVEQIFTPFGYTSADASLLGTIYMLSGVVGSLLIGKMVDLRKCYRIAWLFIQFMTLLGLIVLAYSIHAGASRYIIFALICVLGAGTVTGMPLGTDFGCEVSFPVGEAMSSGLVILLSQIIGAVGVQAAGDINEEVNKRGAMRCIYMMGGVSIVATLLSALIHNDLRRENYEKKRSHVNLLEIKEN